MLRTLTSQSEAPEDNDDAASIDSLWQCFASPPAHAPLPACSKDVFPKLTSFEQEADISLIGPPSLRTRGKAQVALVQLVETFSADEIVALEEEMRAPEISLDTVVVRMRGEQPLRTMHG